MDAVSHGLVGRALGAGERLGACSLEWGRRPAGAVALALTDRDLDVLADLADKRYLSSSQIAAWFWGVDSSALRSRLKRLHDAGWVQKFRPKAVVGSREWNYRLSEAGYRLVAQEGRMAPATERKPSVLTSVEYAAHDLQVAALVLQIATRGAVHADPAGSGPLRSRVPFRWLGEAWGRVDPYDDPLPKDRVAASRLREGWTVDRGRSWLGVIEPDATLIGAMGNAERDAVLIEYDRTGRASKQGDRLRRYDRFLLQGWREGRYATHAHEPAVVFVCAAESQVRSFVRVADVELTARMGRAPLVSRDGVYPGREQIAFTSRERIVADDWRMLQVPTQPPSDRQTFRARGGPPRVEPRSTVLDIPRLFVAPPGG